jgi:tetratricopeptide (TPR) repeat protein
MGQLKADVGAVKKDLATVLSQTEKGIQVDRLNYEHQGQTYEKYPVGVFPAIGATDSRLVVGDGIYLDFAELLNHPLGLYTKGDQEKAVILKLHDVMSFSFDILDLKQATCVFEELAFIKKMEAEAALDRFQPLADRYRAMPTKPAVSEAQRKFIVQANSMTQQKEYAKAMALYRKALDIDPISYPAAYYNMALIASQQENIFGAIHNMKKYLLLLPDAEDARSAQDKIYEWQAKVGE